MKRTLPIHLQQLIPAKNVGYKELQEITEVRKVIPTSLVDFKSGIYKGTLHGFVAEFEINNEIYEVQTTSVSSKDRVVCYLSIDPVGNAIIFTE